MTPPSLAEAIAHMRRVVADAVDDPLFVALVDAGERVVAVQCFVAPNDDWSRVSTSEILDFAGSRRDVTVVTLSRATACHGFDRRHTDIARRLRREAPRRAVRLGPHVAVPVACVG